MSRQANGLQSFFGTARNGDGVLGTSATVPERQGMGLPIFTTRRPDDKSNERVMIARAWTENGQPSSQPRAKARQMQFEYYSPREFGSSAPPTLQTASSGNQGLLARVRSARYDDAYPTTQGPTGANACAALRGPYWKRSLETARDRSGWYDRFRSFPPDTLPALPGSPPRRS